MLQKTVTKDLKVGMFIAELDRPWMDTPFLLQGFLIEDEDQLVQLRGICSWVMIDPMRSIGPEFERSFKKKPDLARDLGEEARVVINHVYGSTLPSSLSDSGNAPRPSGTALAYAPSKPKTAAASAASEERKATDTMDYNVRTMSSASANAVTSHLSPAMTPAPKAEDARPSTGLWHQLKGGLSALFIRKHSDKFNDGKAAAGYQPEIDSSHPRFIPESVQLTIYHDMVSVENEIGFATETYIRTNELLHKVVEDIRIGNDLQYEAVEDVIDDMVASMVRNPDAMMWVAKMREQDINIYSHGLSVAITLVAFGRHLGYPKDQLAHLGMLGLLLDVGKIQVPRELLEKRNRLTAPEFEMVKQHVIHSIQILQKTPNVHPDIVEGVAQHHERVDGSGYPYSLTGGRISVFGRMAAIVDTFAAITKERPYAETVSPHEALQMLSGWSDTQFQGDMVEQFIQSIGVFPVGSLVELSTGEVAAVATHNKLKRLRPKVLVLTEPDKTHHKFPAMRDLLYDNTVSPTYIRRGLPSNSYGLDPREFYLT